MRRKDPRQGRKNPRTRRPTPAEETPVFPGPAHRLSPPLPQSFDALRRLRRTQLLTLARRAGLEDRFHLTKEELVRALGSALGILRPGKATPSRAAPADWESASLPVTYEKDRLVLLSIDPYWVHAYWEIAAPGAAKSPRRPEEPGGEVRWVLRVYDVTHIHFDGTNAHNSFDIHMTPQARSWYINLWSPGKSLCAELGLLRPDGGFSPLVRSNVVQTPPAWASPNTGERWMRVEWREEDRLRAQEQSSIEAGGPAPQPGQRPRLSLGPEKLRPVSRSRQSIRAEEYRRFLEGTHRVRILQTDEPAPPATMGPPGDEVQEIFDPGLSSIQWVKKPEGT